ncbi:hypothetical protein RMSM_07821 [Rhodopirellula maiorica SM1]|uniref:Uncharacterized protein n=1 Tax=Rhodopirellula maiorica SM1 TaxID=1265738 RepID=M5R790_9BACT|nr:hypothetical protein RMSM_07821 [Rhodopirellula maiorica SM1]
MICTSLKLSREFRDKILHCVADSQQRNLGHVSHASCYFCFER